MVKVYSYIVAHDSGFAPNPFHGICTLACCKPVIRRTAKVGDLIVGMSSRCEHIVYAMKVDCVLSFDGYWGDHAGAAKRPDMRSTRVIDSRGDNIYEPVDDGRYRQLPSLHSTKDGTEYAEHTWNLRHDLSGKQVLVGDRFVYFGKDGPPLPSELSFLRVGRGHRCNFTSSQVNAVAAWFATLPQGVVGRPAQWSSNDSSWMEA